MENRFLNESALKDLIQRASTSTDPDAREDLELVKKALEKFHQYVDTVVTEEAKLLLQRSTLTGEDYRNAVLAYDEKRHIAHEKAIGDAKLLNRLAPAYNVPPVFTGDETKRHEIADFCLEVDGYFFRNRMMKLS